MGLSWRSKMSSAGDWRCLHEGRAQLRGTGGYTVWVWVKYRGQHLRLKSLCLSHTFKFTFMRANVYKQESLYWNKNGLRWNCFNTIDPYKNVNFLTEYSGISRWITITEDTPSHRKHNRAACAGVHILSSLVLWMAARSHTCSSSWSRRLFQFPCSLTTAPLRRVISWLRQLGAQGSSLCPPPFHPLLPPPSSYQRLSRQLNSVWRVKDVSSNLPPTWQPAFV